MVQNVKEYTSQLDEVSGPLSRRGISSLLQRTDIFIDMSSYQAFGRTAAECMSSRCFPVVPMVGGSPELFVEGISGIAVNSTHLQEAFDSVKTLVAADFGALQLMKWEAYLKSVTLSSAKASKDVLTLFLDEYLKRTVSEVELLSAQ